MFVCRTSSSTAIRPSRSSTAASHPVELANAAAEQGHEALALTDHDGLHGAMEMAQALTALGIRPITGAEITLDDGHHLTLLCEDARGYRNLCRLLTKAYEKDRLLPSLPWGAIANHTEGLVCLTGCARDGVLAKPIERSRYAEAAESGARLARRLRRGQPACRATAPVRPPRPPPQPPARPARRAARRPHRRHRQRPCTRARARGTPGRVRRGQARHDARRVRAAPARQPLALPRAAGCDGGALSRHAGGGARVGPAGGPASLRPHPGPRLPLPGLGGPGCRSQARAAVRRADRRALRGPRQPRRGARPARARSFA